MFGILSPSHKLCIFAVGRTLYNPANVAIYFPELFLSSEIYLYECGGLQMTPTDVKPLGMQRLQKHEEKMQLQILRILGKY